MAALIVIPMLMPEKMEVVKHFWVTPLESPPVTPWKPQPQPKPKLVPVKRVVVKEIPKPEIELPKPKIYNPVITTPAVRRTVRKEVPAPEVAKMFHDPAPPSMGSSAIPTLQKPRALVQTGGFGDPYGLKAPEGKITRSPNANAAGSFDLPPGPGYGNGTGGAKGARGIVASTGFGNGVATGGNGGGGHGKLEQDTFSDAAAVPTQERAKREAVASNDKPVEILFKPRPAYTSEALAKKIEGEVLLQVVFSASGDVEVGRVVKGLGYGLDASAQTAAREIRFHPAERDGRPVDSSAIVHIVFELAY